MNANDEILPIKLIRECKRKGSRMKVADSTGSKLSGNDLLVRSLVLRRLLLKHVLGPISSEPNVGILLPPTVPAAVVNFALSFCGRTSVNLNYTATAPILNACIDLAKVKHVLTSRKVIEKLNLKLDAEMVFLEDFKEKVGLLDKLCGFAAGRLYPTSMLIQSLGLNRVRTNDTLTIIFTSGSTGTPKGVVLSYGNVNANITALQEALHLRDDDVMIGILPFFHSFGYTVTLWASQVLPLAAVYHYSPLEPKQIAKLASEHQATIFLGTPTFLRSYLRRVEPEQFKSLELVVVGAEKLPMSLSDAFEERFGIRPIEGYGMTEMSPLVSVKLPPSRSHADDKSEGVCEGSVGRPLPKVEARVTHLETRSALPRGEIGMLEVRGPSLMQGYLHRPDLTESVVRDGWYITGDVGMIDEKGFIHITGRQSRFSKIGGEMVPHIQIEESIQNILEEGEGEDSEGLLSIAVTAVPDERKGERLIVLYTQLCLQPNEIIRKLSELGLPNLYLPSEDSFLQVESIPVLGSGKLDLKGLQQLALEKTNPAQSQ